jgi:RND family efflux transporter MFP subunit
MKAYIFGFPSSITSRIKQVLLFCLLFVSILLATSASAQQLETKTIQAEVIAKKINRTGKLTFQRTVNLSFKTSGYLAELTVDEGDVFTKGQVLAQLDNAELVAEKNASYALLLQAKREVNRVKILLNKSLSSQQALDDAKTLVETTRANHKVAQYNLSKAKLFAPFDGVVLARFTELGELQSPSQSALQLAAIDNNLVVRVALPAPEVNLVNLEQKIAVKLAQFGLVTGTVSRIPAIADQQSHLFTIDILLTELKATQVVVGQLAHISTQVTTDKFAYRLPIEALNSVDSQGRALIMLKNTNASSNKFSQQAFEIKRLSNDYIYLSAQSSSLPLTVITRGWQQLALTKAKQENEAK